jgi:hypothetical protein
MERARGGSKTPLPPRTSAGWPPTCVYVTVNKARRYLATIIRLDEPIEYQRRGNTSRSNCDIIYCRDKTELRQQKPSSVLSCTQITNAIEQSPPLEANSCTASQEIPNLLQNPTVQIRVHSRLPAGPILRKRIQYTFSYTISLRPILILSSHRSLSFPSDQFSSRVSTFIIMYAFFICPLHVTGPAHRILLYFNVIITSGGE